MARTINEIQQGIIRDLQQRFPSLSGSQYAEWRLWTWVAAAAIHSFELVLDLFRGEVDLLTTKITSGTRVWYGEMCRRFQNGHVLRYDEATARFYYEEDDPKSRIVEVVAVTEAEKGVYLRVAKTNDEQEIVPLTEEECRNLQDYIDTIHTAGIPAYVVSTAPDLIQWELAIYYDPAVPAGTIRKRVEEALDAFRRTLSFDAMFYKQQLVDAVMHAEGVVTVEPGYIGHRTSSETEFQPVEVITPLAAGYFDYAPGNRINLRPTTPQS